MRIARRFNGPPATGNGGWSAGAFAVAAGAGLGGPAFEVTLRVPPPLETELTFADGSVHDGETLVATVTEAAGPILYAASVALPEAERAAEGFAGFTHHPFPTCYVCGPERPDGLRIFPGAPPDGRTAAPWTVPDEANLPVVWAALDCPGGWTAIQNGRTYLLGRIAVTAEALPEPGSTCVIVGEATEFSGRKAMVLSAIFGPDGSRLAAARATWIATT